MKRAWFVVATLAAVVAFGAYMLSSREEEAPPLPVLVPLADGGQSAPPSSADAQRPRSPMRIGDPLQQPKTEADVEWLVRNAFPTQDEMNEAGAGIASATEFDYSDGVTPREILRAELYAMQRPADAKRAEEFLGRAAADGSIYALESLGRVFSVGPLRNPVRSEAYYRASMLRGNWPAAMRLAPKLPRQDDIIAELMAHQVINNLNRMRASRGQPPLAYDARPGLDEFSRSVGESRRERASRALAPGG